VSRLAVRETYQPHNGGAFPRPEARRECSQFGGARGLDMAVGLPRARIADRHGAACGF